MDAGRGLALSCHPLPCLAVTAFATAYGAAIAADAGAEAGRLVSIAVAVLAGQLCVGWSNDAIDAVRDRTTARADKPLSLGLVGRRTVAVAAVLAFLVCVVLSLRLGAAVGGLHLIAVGCAVAYNAGLKATVVSPLPYLVSFGLLPVVVSLAVTGSEASGGRQWPPLAQVVAAALLGAAAHAGNTVGDTEADAATGVRGMPQRIGPRWSLISMAGLIAVAAIVLLAAVLADDQVPAARRVIAVVLLAGGVALAFTGAARRVGVPGGEAAWRLTLAAVTLVIAGFLAAV